MPEAQLDRFMFNVILDYPSYEEELEVVKKTTTIQDIKLDTTMQVSDILKYQELIRKIPVPDNVLEYIVSLVLRTRPDLKNQNDVTKYIDWGAGPRASQYMLLAAKCHAAIHGKYSPDIEDVRAVAKPVLRHRIVRNYKAEAEGVGLNEIIEKLL